MDEVRGAQVARGSTPSRASPVAAVLERLRRGAPLPAAAHGLAAAGVPVFPCVPGEKGPMVTYGYREASRNLRRVDGWWRWQPGANIGIPTGRFSGFVVVDIDVHGVDGYESAARAARAGLIPAPLAEVRTPTGGRHLYFPADPERVQRSWHVADAGVDFRGDGGYVVVAPSALVLGGRRVPYRVEAVSHRPASPVDADRLRDFLTPRPDPVPFPASRVDRSLDAGRLAAWVSRRMEGERNAGLFWATCRMAEQGTPPNDALSALGPAAVQTGLTEREITRTVGSAYRHVHSYGPRTRAPLRTEGQTLARATAQVSPRARTQVL
ncbi:DNA primase [Enemella evansiae]|uniref:DNA primase n=1 Tax=Enemella evansiae TaxID=2016499 RepID=A0A255G389_9ACTN|nr:bifunctional DNA primase/polymerase [Enemella evansiae]OYO08846.1 DNA primase [Enemella evansiae]